jgi:predicted nucleic acid-binding protein
MASTDDAFADASDELLRALIDSSVLMASVLSVTGAAYDLLEAGRQGRIALVVSTYVLREVERNLNRKAPRGLAAFSERRVELEIVDPLVELVADVARDIEAKDAPIVAAALSAHAEYLVTYDRRHLLAHADLIRQHFQIETVEPAVLMTRLMEP